MAPFHPFLAYGRPTFTVLLKRCNAIIQTTTRVRSSSKYVWLDLLLSGEMYFSLQFKAIRKTEIISNVKIIFFHPVKNYMGKLKYSFLIIAIKILFTVQR